MTNRQLLRPILAGLLEGALRRRQELRFQLVREGWTIVKRFSAGHIVRNVDLRELPELRDRVSTAYVDDRNRAVLAALCQALGARTFLEIGTNRGRTALSVARSVPELRVLTLDLPDPEAAQDAALELIDADRGVFGNWRRGEAFREAPEAGRIEQLLGDSATFDFSPWAGSVDVVFIDGSHSYPYVRSDTAAARQLLSARGAIVWDDYPAFPGVYAAVREARSELGGEVLHVVGTRMALWVRGGLEIEPLALDEHRSVSAA